MNDDGVTWSLMWTVTEWSRVGDVGPVRITNHPTHKEALADVMATLGDEWEELGDQDGAQHWCSNTALITCRSARYIERWRTSGEEK